MDDFMGLWILKKWDDLLSFSKNTPTIEGRLWEVMSLQLMWQYEEASQLLEKRKEEFEIQTNIIFTINYNLACGIQQSHIGEFDKSYKFFNQALTLSLEHKLDLYAFRCYLNLCQNFNAIGESDKAIEELTKAFKFTGNNKLLLGDLNRRLGFFSLTIWDLKTAIINFKKSYEISKEISDLYGLCNSLHGLGIANCMMGNIEQAGKILEEFKGLLEKCDNLEIRHRYKFTKAVYLMNLPRMRDKAEALDLFTTLLRDPKLGYFLRMVGHLHTISLLFEEYRMNKGAIILEELKEYLNNYYSEAEKNHIIPHMTHALIIKAQLSTTEGDFKDAEQLLKEALVIAEKQGKTKYVDNVKNAQKRILDEFSRMQELIKRNVDLSERLNQSSMVQYIQKALKFVEVDQ